MLYCPADRMIQRVLFCMSFLYIISPGTANSCLLPAVVGSPLPIKQTINISSMKDTGFIWNIKKKNIFIPLCTCYWNPQKEYCDECLSGYHATIINIDQTYEIVLTIESVKRVNDGVVIETIIEGDSQWNCTLQAIDFKSTPSCSPPSIESTVVGDNITLKCSIFGVYPEPKCEFSQTSNMQPIASEYNHEEEAISSTNNPVFYSKVCTMLKPVTSAMEPGDYKFMVSMYPDVTNGRDFNSTTESSVIALFYPEPELINCPKGYIKEGTTETCECQLKSAGNPPGQAKWLNETNGEGNVLSFSFTYGTDDPNPVYSCRGVSSLGNSELHYKPNFTYGPSSIAEFKVPSELKLCSTENTFNVTCSIDKKTVNPKPIVEITGPGHAVVLGNVELKSGNYIFSFTYKLDQSIDQNIITITCKASNSLYADISTEDNKGIHVQKPPPSPPVMTTDIDGTFQNGQTVIVTSGQTVQVYCDVQGGLPSVRKVNITCADQRYEKDTQSSLDLILNKSNNGEKCFCTAIHRSGCYDKETQFTFNVQYNAEVLKYTAMSQKGITVEAKANNFNTSQLEVDKGAKVTFVCEGEGNPRPDINIQRSNALPLQSKVTESDEYVKTVAVTKIMACRDTGNYVCEAANHIGKSGRTILTLVKCPSQLEYLENQNKSFSPVEGNQVVIEIEVFGHPRPYEFKLNKQGAGGHEIDSTRYKASYNKVNELNGVVRLVMNNITDTDIGQFELMIKNGIGDGLKYSFLITMTPESTSDDTNVAVIAIAIVAVILVIFIIVAVVILYRKGKLQKCLSRMGFSKDAKKDKDQEEMYTKENVLYGNGRKNGVSKESRKARVAAKTDSNIETFTSEIYNMKPASSTNEVKLNNEIYGTNPNRDSSEVTLPNEIYGMNPNRDSTEVRMENTVYGKGPAKDHRGSLYKDYKNVETTITTATALPKNMKSDAYKDDSFTENPYEDLEEDGRPGGTSTSVVAKPKPLVPNKPKRLSVTKNEHDNVNTSVRNQSEDFHDDVGNTYSSVDKGKVSFKAKDNPYINRDEVDLFPSQSEAPAIPKKNFNEKLENEIKGGDKEKKAPEKKPKGKKNVPLPPPSNKSKLLSGFSSEKESQHPTSYTNEALDVSQEEGLYAN